MTTQVSKNIRYLLWKRGVNRSSWASWLETHSLLGSGKARALIGGKLNDAELSPQELGELARSLEIENDGESLRFADFAQEANGVLRENLKFLFDSLGYGGKKTLATELGIDPTTISRWLNGAYEPNLPTIRQLVTYFGLPPLTDLREEPVFLSVEPVALAERRRWLHSRIEALSSDMLRELYPALRRLLEER